MFKRFLILAMCLVGLSGCVGDQRGSIDQSDDDSTLKILKYVKDTVQGAPPPIINVPPAEKVDTADLKNSINISSEKTANQMSGLLNANVSKLTDQIKGVEANIGKLAEINNQMTANLTNRIDTEIKASAEFKAQLQASIQSNIELKAQLQAQLTAIVNISNDMKADLKAIATVTARLENQMAGIAGIGNSISQLQQEVNNKAGRDVNYLPKEAMYIVIGVVLLLVILLGVTFYLIFKSNAKSMDLRYKEATNTTKSLYNLLLRSTTLLAKAKNGTTVVSASDMGSTRDANEDSIDKIMNDAQTLLKENTDSAD